MSLSHQIKQEKKHKGFVISLKTFQCGNFFEDIPMWPKPMPAICIYCDSEATITRAQNHIYYGKSRHICRRHNTVRHLLSHGIISIEYVKSRENIVDPLTKGLAREQVYHLLRRMRLKHIT